MATSTAETSTSSAAESSPGCYLIVHNVSKRHNIGTLVRSAAAFSVTEVCPFNPLDAFLCPCHVSGCQWER